MKAFLKKIRNLLLNNWILKITSLVLAAVIWLAVVNSNDPTKTVTINDIPIVVTNEKAITEKGQVYELKGRPLVNVTVSGRRSIVDDLEAGSFNAEASLEELSLTNSVPVTISLKSKNIENKVAISKQSVNQITVEIEDLITKTYAVEPNIIGTLPESYSLGRLKMSLQAVDITAPVSVHDKIKTVRADININGIKNNFANKYRILPTGEDGKTLDLGDHASMSAKKMRVSIKILRTVTVPVELEPQGNPASGFELAKIDLDPENVTLTGPASAVSAIKKVGLTGDIADIEGIRADEDRTADVEDYIDSSVTAEGDSEIKISIHVEGDITREIAIPVQDIAVLNVPAGCEAVIRKADVSVTFTGKERDFNNINSRSLHPSVDLEGLPPGKHNVKVNITVPDGLRPQNGAEVTVRIKQKR